ncbi:DUF2292 domain-containing protein [Arenimonas sp.]|uniref:DUF2292 domain-containing protein n=1 Tax=Arenimonas sp. TaxID=1872635 RepID=UPI0039E67A89
MEIRTQQEASELAPSSVRLNAHELAVLDAIRATPFGTIEVVLHQSRIVQVVKTEKVRLEPTA